MERASQRGIKAEHVLRYLNTNAHPKVVEKTLSRLTEHEKKKQNIKRKFSFVPNNVVASVQAWCSLKDTVKD
jgi:hypothetical protein